MRKPRLLGAVCCALLASTALALTPVTSERLLSKDHGSLAPEALRNAVPAQGDSPKFLSDAAQGKASGLLALESEALSKQAPLQKTEHQSFFSRLQESVTNFVVGWILIIFSFPILWFNESRNARMETLLGRGRSQCRSVSGGTPSKENRNWLVHLEGEPMKSAAPVSDKQFDVALETDCVRLRRTVEVFQYIQHEKKEEKEKLGGGKDTITTYTYTTEWSSSWHDSSNYSDSSKHNTKPGNLDVGTATAECSRVEYGEGFILSEELVVQCDSFTSAASRLGAEVKLKSGGTVFHKRGDSGLFYYSVNAGSSGAGTSPSVGDARVTFEYVADGPASVLALQVDGKGDARDTFLPFRLINRGICGGISEDDEKVALKSAGEMSRGDLAAQAQMGTGCLWCLCCACNLVNMCFAGLLVPEIYHLFQGSKSSSECFGIVHARMRMMVWGLRLVGWLLLFGGLYLLFSPFLTFIKVIPFLGPILSNLGGWLIWFLCFFVTLAVATVVICLAYLVYHPLLALLYSAVAAAIIVIPIAIVHAVA